MPDIIPVIIIEDEAGADNSENFKEEILFNNFTTDKESLFESTIRAALSVADMDHIITISPLTYAPLVANKLKAINIGLNKNLIIEPGLSNPVAAISLASCLAMQKFEEAVLWVMPVHQTEYYLKTLKAALNYSLRAASAGNFVLFGLKPFLPSKDNAYILSGKHFEDYNRLQQIRMFIPHPNEQVANSIWQQPYCFTYCGNFLVGADYWYDYLSEDIKNLIYRAYENMDMSHYGLMPDKKNYNDVPPMSLTKYLGLTAQQNTHPLCCYNLGGDSSSLNGWYQIWQNSMRNRHDRVSNLEKFLDAVTNENKEEEEIAFS